MGMKYFKLYEYYDTESENILQASINNALSNDNADLLEDMHKNFKIDYQYNDKQYLKYAIENNKNNVLSFLIKKTKDINTIIYSRDSITLFNKLSKYGRLTEKNRLSIIKKFRLPKNTIKLLFENDGIINGNLKVLKLLMNRHNVDPSMKDNWGIKHASGNGNTRIVKQLLKDERVDPTSDDNWAIKRAMTNGHKGVVKVLKSHSNDEQEFDINNPIDSYGYDTILDLIRRKGKRLKGNTTATIHSNDAIAIRYHSTDVATTYPDGSVMLDSGGWETSTTQDRINRFSPASVFSYKGRWTARYGNDNPSYYFEDGMILYPNGKAVRDNGKTAKIAEI